MRENKGANREFFVLIFGVFVVFGGGIGALETKFCHCLWI